ncbi:MAG TPA: putative LPS assembly protein LptD [Bacteroidales bacterium]|nr:putative LPS assembly protein LptD [Bacteroidales bacterium]
MNILRLISELSVGLIKIDLLQTTLKQYRQCMAACGLMLLLLMIQKISLAQTETTVVLTDTLTQKPELVRQDTLGIILEADKENQLSENDTLTENKPSIGLEYKVLYNAYDKIHFDVKNKKVYLYFNADITYGDIRLKADYVEIDFARNQVYACGIPDSTGVVRGNPVFAEGDQEFEAEEITYNFDTKKGIIQHVITQDGEGYVHGDRIKKLEDDRINVSSGSYTTCSEKKPHFEFRYKKAQSVPNKRIVSGPAWLVIEGVPMPLAIPFGLFPNKSGQRSGIIIPRFGESANRGFYLERLGYYWGISDYFDFAVSGDIFTNGSWAVRPTFRYVKRYKFRGNFDLNYAKNFTGDRDSPDQQESTDFSLIWSHSQDPNARPNSRFTANVNIVTRNFNQYNLTSTDAYLSNTFQSSVAYQTNFRNSLFLTLSGTHQQNTIDGSVNITLPTFSLSSKQFYPFRRKEQVGKIRWYENITMKYTMTGENRIQTADSLLFKKGWEDDLKSGIRHSIPVSSSIKVLKYFTLTNSVDYTERWYPYSIRKTWNNDTIFTPTDTISGRVMTDTVRSFNAARDFSYSASLNTRLYGMFQFSRGPLVAVRHVLTPSVSFSLRPDFGAESWGYWDEVQINQQGDTQRYSYFEGLLYGGPQDGKSGNLSFSLSNNLEAKVRSKRDTVSGTRKIVLIENLSISAGYDLAKDSLNWSAVSISGRTTLFKRLSINYSSSWDPYAVDSLGRTINQLEWDINRRIFRMRNTTWNFGVSFRISHSDFKKGGQQQTSSPPINTEEQLTLEDKYTEQAINDVLDNPDMYINWNNPWSLNLTYNLRFTNNPRFMSYEWMDNRTRVQTVGLTGDLNLTSKWKIGFRTGYDFEDKKFSFTTLDFYRDLHCWEMRFSWTPLGFRKSWSFGINVKAAILQDLKYERKKDFRDGFR